MKTWDKFFKFLLIFIALIAVISIAFTLITAASTIHNIVGAGVIVFAIWYVGRYIISQFNGKS